MTYQTILLSDLPNGSEFCFSPAGPIWVKCSEVWYNRFGYPVITAFLGNHYARYSANFEVYPLPLVLIYEINDQLTLF